MVRGLYTSAAGALVAQASIDVVANNLANSSTDGFKRALLQVESQPMSDLYRYQTDPGQNPSNRTPGVATQAYVGQLGSGSQVYATPTNYEQGPITANDNPYSFALSGPGFFAIRDPQTGTVQYTRDGQFMPGADGNLATVSGADVLGPNGQPIPIPTTGTLGQNQLSTNGKIQVDKQGNINLAGNVFGQIGVFEFNNLQSLQPQGSTNYIDPGTAGVHAATGTNVLQYSEERSNGSVIQSMVSLITNERWFEANEKSISTQDDATGQALSTVGRSTAS